MAWLERRLSGAIKPITPRPEFIHRAREELMALPPGHPMPTWVKPGVLAAVVLSLLALVATLFYLRRRD